MNLIKTLTLSAAVVFTGFAANAATMMPTMGGDCGSDTLNNGITVNMGCELGSSDNDGVGGSSLDVNDDSMFDVSSWEYLAKDNGLNGSDEGSMQDLLNITSSEWSIGEDGGYAYYMIVLKGSNAADTSPDTYIGYLIDGNGTLMGEVSTPFTKDGQTQAISHGTLYGYGERMSEVPVPAAGFLLLAGLGGLAAMRRRK